MSAWLHPTARRAAISSPMVIGPGVRHDCPFASGAVTSAVHNLFRAVISCGVSLIGTNPAPTERQPAHEVRGGGCPLLFGLRCRSPRSPPMPGLTARHLPRFSVIVKRSSALSVLRGSSSCEHAVGPRRYSKSRRVVVGVVECRDL